SAAAVTLSLRDALPISGQQPGGDPAVLGKARSGRRAATVGVIARGGGGWRLLARPGPRSSPCSAASRVRSGRMNPATTNQQPGRSEEHTSELQSLTHLV